MSQTSGFFNAEQLSDGSYDRVYMAQQFAYYDINNDPYGRIREDRRQKMENVVDDVFNHFFFYIH